ncbi:MAG: hypothetical protein NZM04_01705 [Methylacidiphilales bacterium]|nr:hypothetical protein [Candidatus Methylacidiphilales bacterium]
MTLKITKCLSNSDQKKYITDQIKIIENFYKTVKSEYELYLNRNFVEIYLDSENYLDSIFHIMTNKKTSTDQKIICIYLLSKIDKDQYIQIFKKYFDLMRSKNKIEVDILTKFIYPGVGWNDAFIVRYKDQNVRGILLNIRACDPMLSKLADMILSGKLYEEYIKSYIDPKSANGSQY